MGNFRQIFYQIVFSTKNRVPAIFEEHETDLYKYIWVIKNKRCTLYQINGMPDHLHIFSDLHPSISLSDFIKDIKIASNLWMKESGKFPEFEAWQSGYGAFTYSIREKEKIVNYIRHQKAHHKKENFIEEFRRVLEENDVAFEEKYLL